MTNRGGRHVLKKSDLYSSLWKSFDELRAGVDASQYTDYILTLLFVKYVADKSKADPNSLVDVPKCGSFDDILKLKGNEGIGDKVIGKLAEANDLQKVIISPRAYCVSIRRNRPIQGCVSLVRHPIEGREGRPGGDHHATKIQKVLDAPRRLVGGTTDGTGGSCRPRPGDRRAG